MRAAFTPFAGLLVAFHVFLFPAALAAAGTVLHGDANWAELATGVNKEFTDIACPDGRTCYITAGLYDIGGTGAVLKTSDGGDTFTTLSIPTSNPLHAISCSSADSCFAVGDFGTFLVTSDGGGNWQDIALGSKADPPRLTSVFAFDGKRAIAAGKDGFITLTNDGGRTFVPPAVRTFADLYGIHFLDAFSGFIVGNGGALLATVDGGNTWTTSGALRDAGALASIAGKKGGMLVAAGDQPYASADEGKTWTRRTTGMGQGYHAVAAASATTAYIVSDANVMYKTTDGGAHWNADFAPTGVILRHLTCPSEGYCIAVGSYGKAYRRGMPPLLPPAPAPVTEATSTSVAAAAASAVSSLLASPAAAASSTPALEPTATVVPAPASLVAATSVPASASAPASASSEPTASTEGGELALNRTVKKGARGDEVKRAQMILVSLGLLAEDDATGYFGARTVNAIGAFQTRYGIAKKGGSGYGQAGPKTRAKLVALAAAAAARPVAATHISAPAFAEAAFSRTLRKGVRGGGVKELQRFLAADGSLYPEGDITGYFGPATARAVGRLQEKYGIAAPGKPGYGQLGPKTRAKVNELMMR